MKPVVAIVGRPNVGKSTLFNRLVGHRAAIVEDFPGVTRDRQYGDAEVLGAEFILVDTGGFEPETNDEMLQLMRSQAEIAIGEADVVIMMFDCRAGLLPADREITQMLKRTDKRVHYAVNKVDGPRHDPLVGEFWELGIHELWPISAQHAHGVLDLMEAVIADFPEGYDVEEEREEGVIRVAVVGKPNAGKSTLVNRFLGEERMLVSDVPGTTRDAIDSRIERPNPVEGGPPRKYLIIDTAGVRRRKWIKTTVEKISIVRTFKSIDRADVCLLLIDAKEGVTDQDAKIARLIADKGKACVLLINKWDAIEKDEATHGVYVKAIRSSLSFVDYAPVMTMSAMTGQRTHKIFETIDLADMNHMRRVSTGELNRIIDRLYQTHNPPIYKGRRLKIYYATQVSVRCPTFILFVNDPDALATSYKRFILNRLREHFDFTGTPIKLAPRKRSQKQDRERPGKPSDPSKRDRR